MSRRAPIPHHLRRAASWHAAPAGPAAGRIMSPREDEEVDLTQSILALELWGPDHLPCDAFIVIDGISADLALAAVNRYHWEPQPLVSCGPLLMASRWSGLEPRLMWSDEPDQYLATMLEGGVLRDLPCDVVMQREWRAFSSRYLLSMQDRFPFWQRVLPDMMEF